MATSAGRIPNHHILYNQDCDIAAATIVASNITSVNGVAVSAVSGKIVQTGEDAVFGAFIPEPSKDESNIQPWDKDCDELISFVLFELIPIHDVSWGNVGRPGWTELSP